MSITNGNERDNTSTKILTNRIIELKKLQEARMQVVETTRIQHGIEHYGVNKRIQKIV
jgi:hypothetical protein